MNIQELKNAVDTFKVRMTAGWYTYVNSDGRVVSLRENDVYDAFLPQRSLQDYQEFRILVLPDDLKVPQVNQSAIRAAHYNGVPILDNDYIKLSPLEELAIAMERE